MHKTCRYYLAGFLELRQVLNSSVISTQVQVEPSFDHKLLVNTAKKCYRMACFFYHEDLTFETFHSIDQIADRISFINLFEIPEYTRKYY